MPLPCNLRLIHVPRRAALGFAAGVALLTSALTLFAPVSAAAKPLNVVATTGMIGDAIRQVGGDRVSVTVLMNEGVDPHTYRQTSSDVVAITRADAVFWHGLNLEAQLTNLFEQVGKKKPVLALGERLAKDRLLADTAAPGKPDPHVWMDPRMWRDVVTGVRDELIKIDSDGRAAYDANAARYLKDIDTLAVYADRVLATVPASERALVTAHDAFNYFGRAYGYEVIGIQGVSTESEAGLKQIETIVAQIVDRKIRSVFVESSVSERNVKALVEGAAAKGHEVAIGGELYSDAMGKSGSYEGTYIGMIDHNVTVIARALGGEAPKDGANQRLASMQ